MSRWIRFGYWVVLGATYVLSLWFAVYLFMASIPATLILLGVGAFAARWSVADWLLPASVLTASGVTCATIVAVAWGEDVAWAGPLMVWIATAYVVVSLKFGQMLARRRRRVRANAFVGQGRA